MNEEEIEFNRMKRVVMGSIRRLIKKWSLIPGIEEHRDALIILLEKTSKMTRSESAQKEGRNEN